jgi:hypothetical protein
MVAFASLLNHLVTSTVFINSVCATSKFFSSGLLYRLVFLYHFITSFGTSTIDILPSKFRLELLICQAVPSSLSHTIIQACQNLANSLLLGLGCHTAKLHNLPVFSVATLSLL